MKTLLCFAVSALVLHSVLSLRCYSCNSDDNECDESKPGTLKNCTNAKLCQISKADNVFVRECYDAGPALDTPTTEPPPKPGCHEEQNPYSLECLCDADECNKSWEDAGYNGIAMPTTSITLLATAIAVLASVNNLSY